MSILGLSLWENVRKFSSKEAAEKAAKLGRKRNPSYEYKVFPEWLSDKFLLFRRKK
jgi:hypothetical protein